MNKREVRSTPHTIQKRKQSQRVINDLDNVDFIPSNRKLCCMCMKTTDAVIKMIIKGRSPTNEDMFPEPTELLLIGCSIESIWIPRSKSNTLTPKTNPHAGEAINDFWSMSGNFIYRHHVEPRVKLYSPREESFPVPLKYIDVSRTSQTNLDVMQESRIDDFWNIDGSRDLSNSWTGLTHFALLDEKPPDGYMWSWERLTKRKATSRPDHLRPDLWIKLGRMPENYKEFISLTLRTRDSRKPLRMLERNWKTPMAPAVPCKKCKKSKNEETRSKTDDFKAKFACILEASESTRRRMEESLPKYHEDHIAGKKWQFTATLQFWYTIDFLCLKQWIYPQQKQHWIKNGRKLKRFRRGT